MPKYVGLDIGSHAVKVAVVRTAYRKTMLEGLASEEIAARGGLPEAVKAALGEALGAPGAGDGLAVALEGGRVAVRTVEVPASAQRQLADILPFEIEAVTPLDMSASVFDYRIVGGGPAKGTAMLDVMVAVANAQDVRACIARTKELAGAEPERVGVGALPIAQLVDVMPELSAPGPIAILELGAAGSELAILAGGEPVYARSLPLGTEGLPATAPKLAREVRMSLVSYRAQGGASPVEVVLCGGGVFVSGAESFLSAELELPVRRLPALGPALEMGERAARHASELPLYAKALGLALGLAGRGPATFDLRRGALAYEGGYAWVREKVPVLAGLVAVILVSFVFSTAMQLYAANKEHVALDGALASVSKEVLGDETHSTEHANLLLQQSGAADEDPMPHADAFDVMVRISEAIPQSMVHDIEELDFQKGRANVHGVVATVQDAQSIGASLHTDKCLQDVKIARTSQVVGGARQKYVMEFELKCPEDQKAAAKKKGSTAPASATASTGGK